MAVGGCFCGNVRVEYTGQPIKAVNIITPSTLIIRCADPSQQALCHCSDCRKLTGTLFTYSFIVKNTDLKVTGSPKEVAKTADSGNHIKNYFCPDCGS